MKSPQSKCLIDWGSSNFRAWIVNSDGRLIEEYQYPLGILDPAVENKTAWFESLIEELRFDYPNLEFLAVGMIGSTTGIKNTKYLPSPCSYENWATKSESFITSTGRAIEIFPGLIANAANPQQVDVIRGEEFLIFTSNHANSAELFICPGTHSKWISTSNSEVLDIHTFTTGELFESLVTKSSISQLMSAEITQNGFLHGLTIATTSRALTNSIFKLRAQFLSGYLSVEDIQGAASGLLIGTEFVHAAETVGRQKSAVLVGSKANCELYQRASDFFGITSIIDETTIEQRVARLVEMRSRQTERVNS